MTTSRLVTYIAAIIVAGLAIVFPASSFVLAPIASALLGYAKTHPADKAELDSAKNQLSLSLSALSSSQRAQALQREQIVRLGGQ